MMQSGKRSRKPVIAWAPAQGVSRKSRRNSRKVSPASASFRACSNKVLKPGRPMARQMRGRDLMAAIVRKDYQHTTVLEGWIWAADPRGEKEGKTIACGGRP